MKCPWRLLPYSSKNRHSFQCELLQLSSDFVFYFFLCLLLSPALWNAWASHCFSVSLGVYTCKVKKCWHHSKLLSFQSDFFSGGSHCVPDACDHFLHYEPPSGPQTMLSSWLLPPLIQYLQAELIIFISNLILFWASVSCSDTTFHLAMRARDLGGLPDTLCPLPPPYPMDFLS